MAKVLLIVDSATGALIDVAGNNREGGRYNKFVGRILSLDKNPNLDYGVNGGDTLTVSNGGYNGKEIILKAKKVTISGDLKVNGNAVSSGDGKLYSTAAYPAWDEETIYHVGTSVSYKGEIWTCISEGPANIPPDDEDGASIWGDSPRTIDELKQDALTDQQLANIAAVPEKADKQDISGKRGVLDMGVRGAPEGAGSWFVVGSDTFQFSAEDQRWEGYNIEGHFVTISKTQGGYYIYDEVSTDGYSFSLDENYSFVGYGLSIVGYTGTLAKESQIPTSTSQLINDGAPDGGGSHYASENYVNTAVATNTANFLGTFDYVTDLHFNPPASSSDVSNSAISTSLLAVVSSPSNNDYVFVKIDYTATTPEDEFRRFKFDSSVPVWRYEYTLNSASFTQEQWAAINSGITASKVSQIESKLDGAAAYPAWDPQQSPYELGYIVSHKGRIWRVADEDVRTEPEDGNSDWVEVNIKELKQDKLSSQQIGYINAVPGKADKAVPSAAGNLASLTAQGNLADSGTKASDFATPSDLPYRIVVPGEWEFSDGQVHTITGPAASIGGYNYYADSLYASQEFETEADALDALMLNFTGFTATRPSLSGHLCDRAVNIVNCTSYNTTITAPARVEGESRDFYLVATPYDADSVNTISLVGSGSETITWIDGVRPTFPLVSNKVGTLRCRITELAQSCFLCQELPATKLTSTQIEYINSVPSKAQSESPTFTGTPTAPTAAAGTNTTQLATTAFVQTAVSSKMEEPDLSYGFNSVTLGPAFQSSAFPITYNDGAGRRIEGNLGVKITVDSEHNLILASDLGSDGYGGSFCFAYFNGSTGVFDGNDAPISDLSFNGSSTTTLDLNANYGNLKDRCVNSVSITAGSTLSIPQLEHTGKSRDFYLKMTVTGSQSVSFSPSTGITYTGLGNPTKTYSSGTYLLHFRETSANEFCVTDMFTDATLSNEGAAADANAVGDAITPLQMAAWYPDGSVKSPDEWTPKWDGTTGLKYNEAEKDVVNKTITVCSFFNNTSGTAENNSHLSGRVVIPPYVDIDGERYTVDGIRTSGSFGTMEDNSSIESVVAPTTVNSIGGSCFRMCSALTSVTAPAATRIYDSAFYYCTALASISLPVATNFGLQVFGSCSSLTRVSLPSASSAGNSMFNQCQSLVSASIPAAIVSQDFFRRCYSLKSVSLPNATSIGPAVFEDCTSLEYVDFGNAPRSSVPTLSHVNAFSNVPTSCVIIVPDAQYDAWIAANNWSTLYSTGYRFLKHSEWEFARKYELEDAMDGKRGLLDMNVYNTAWRGGPEGGQTYLFSLKEDNLWATSDDPASAIKLVWWGAGTGWAIEIPSPAETAFDTESGADAQELRFTVDGVAWDLVRVVEPKAGDALAKVSQIPAAQVNADWNAASGVAQILNKPTIPSAYTDNPAMDGTGSAGSSNSFARGDHVHPSDTSKASLTDLPYALVEPGKWEFSGSGYTASRTYRVRFSSDSSYAFIEAYDPVSDLWDIAASPLTDVNGTELSLSWGEGSITATRPSLPGHLLDRAVNKVDVSTTTTLTLPALVNAGKSRDLLVRLTVSADSAVTFSATTGETITWDDAGSPTATYEAGTHLLRFTEVGLDNGSHVFHFTDLGNAAIDPAILAAKLDSTSAAPAWSYPLAYDAGAHVTYLGVLYECVVAHATTSSSDPPPDDLYDSSVTPATGHWKVTDMSTPDATFDIMANGFARLVGADGTLLWQQGYDLNGTTSSSPADGGVDAYAFAANASDAVSLTLPSVTTGKVGDFILDVTNPALDSGATGYPSAFSDSSTYAVGDKVAYDSKIWRCTTAVGTAGAWTGSTNWELAYPYFSLPSTASFVTPRGMNISDMLSFAPGTMCELYFTLTSFAIGGKPTWKVARQDVEAVS